MNKPAYNEYAEFYASYVSMVPNGDIINILEKQREETINFIQNLNEKQAQFRYASGKWSTKEVIGHLADTEHYMSYRLFCIARGEKAPLPGHDQNSFVKEAMFDRFSVAELQEEYAIVRNATIHLLKNIRTDVWKNWGNANGNLVTVRAIAYIIAGHELHHRSILTERYFHANDFPNK